MPHRELTIDGVYYPSVTEILGDAPKPWLQKWRDKWGVLADRKMRAAANVGTAFHAFAEALINGIEVVADGRLYGMLLTFDRWVIESGFRLQETELHVVSKAYKYQGTFDAIGYLADKPKTLCLFDWKTSSGIYPDMALQLVAYAQAYKEQTGLTIRRGLIVHVSKSKPHHKLTVKEYKLTKGLLNKFLKRLKEYNEARGL